MEERYRWSVRAKPQSRPGTRGVLHDVDVQMSQITASATAQEHKRKSRRRAKNRVVRKSRRNNRRSK